MNYTAKEALKDFFKNAKEDGAKLFAIEVQMEGFKFNEVIINHIGNLDDKMAYWDKTYGDDLVHKHSPGIKIVDYTHAHTFEEVYGDLNAKYLPKQESSRDVQ